MLWIVLRPLIQAAVYGTVFTLLLPRDTRPGNFVAFLVVGIFAFQFFGSCLNQGSRAVTSNLGLVRTLRFPRALLVLATIGTRALGLGPMLAVLVVLVLATGEPLTWRWLQLPLAFGLLVVFCLGVALVAARLTIHVRDLSEVLPFVVRLLFYTSGVFYSIERTVEGSLLRTLLEVNPVATYLALPRGAVMQDLPADPWRWAAGAGWAVGALLVGYVFFWAGEERYGRE